jgi:hypothetical protein
VTATLKLNESMDHNANAFPEVGEALITTLVDARPRSSSSAVRNGASLPAPWGR